MTTRRLPMPATSCAPRGGGGGWRAGAREAGAAVWGIVARLERAIRRRAISHDAPLEYKRATARREEPPGRGASRSDFGVALGGGKQAQA